MRCLAWLVACSAAVLAGQRSQPYTSLPGFRPSDAVLWRNPGRGRRDLRYGPGGRALFPRAPFTFLKEDLSGTSPKVQVRDANDRRWDVKFGIEARPDVFCSRLAWAIGYYAEPNYYLAGEIIEGAHDLKRARLYIGAGGRAQGGRFQLRSKYPEYMAHYSWAWDDNPFLGTPQFNGFRIMMMLVSNWDDKDLREDDARGIGARYHELMLAMKRGTNNAIMKEDGRYMFFVDDWGASLGNWGPYMTRTKWDCVDFYRQSDRFVRRNGDRRIEWGYNGINTPRMTEGIRTSDIEWLLRYLDRITDAQLRDGLLASGATPDEAYWYTKALRIRISQLEEVAGAGMVTRAR